MARSATRTLILRIMATIVLFMIVGFVMQRWWLCHGMLPPLSEIFPHGALVIAVDASYPPFAVATADDLYGLDIDLGAALGERIGIPVRFVNMGFDGLYDSLKTGQTDVIISALLMDGARFGDVRYTRYYFDAGLILIRQTGDFPNGILDVAGQSLAYEFGSAADAEARLWARRFEVRGLAPFLPMPYELPQYALDAVRLGRADAALVDAISGRLYMREHPDWAAITDYDYMTHTLFAAAVRIDRKFVYRLVNGALQAMHDDGSLEALIARWL